MIKITSIQPQIVRTVEEAIIADASNPVSTSNTMASYLVNDVIVPLKNVMSRYYDVLSEYTETEVLDPIYYMKPGYYSYKKYGTYSMDHIIMSLNNVIEPMDFKMTNIRYLTDDGVGLLLGLIDRDSSSITSIQSSIGFAQYKVIKEP